MLLNSPSYALSCWILFAAVVLVVFFVGFVMIVAVNPDLVIPALWLIGAFWLTHIVLFVLLYRSLDTDPLLAPSEASEIKQHILLLGYIGALETFHVARRNARAESQGRAASTDLPG